MADEMKESHDSYGLIGFYRTSGDPGPLFGSSIQHSNYITLRISRASRRRDLSNHWYHGRERLIELAMSATQFADLITTMGHGDGHPCTLRRVGREQMPPCPEYRPREQFEDEFKAHCRDAMDKSADLVAAARAILAKPTILKSDRAELLGKLQQLEQQVRSNLPFVHGQFNEAMDKTVTEAKGEVEAFVATKIASLGIDALRQQIESRQFEGIDVPMLPDVGSP